MTNIGGIHLQHPTTFSGARWFGIEIRVGGGFNAVIEKFVQTRKFFVKKIHAILRKSWIDLRLD